MEGPTGGKPVKQLLQLLGRRRGDHDRQQRCGTLHGPSQARTARRVTGHDRRTAGSACAPRAAVGAACGPGGAGWSGCSARKACQQNENAQHTSAQCRRIARSLRTWKSAQPSSPLTCL